MLEETSLYFHIFIKLLLGLVFITIYLKLSNKSQISELTPIDIIGNFILGGIIEGVIYDPEISLTQYIVTLFIAILLITFLNYIIMKFIFIRRAVMGASIPVIINGKLQLDAVSMKDTKFDLIDFMARLRSKDIFSIEEVEFAQIEANGEISVLKKGEGHFNYLLVKSGQILKSQLDNANKTEEWLMDLLSSLNIELKDIFLVEFSRSHHLYIVKNDETTISIDV